MPRGVFLALIALTLVPHGLQAQAASPLFGRVVDETGGALPGALVQLTMADRSMNQTTETGGDGRYRFATVPPGRYSLSFSEMNFATIARHDVIVLHQPVEVNITLHLTMSAHIVVTAKETFRNLADLDHPEDNLVGAASAASEGAVTAQQIEDRPIMRVGEVLETVPGLIISQHSGEGKANQYYLRGFNLDHGTDFATTVAGMPINLPTNAHGQGYSDLNFLIPELVTGVQYRKGPYFAEDGDFSAAGSASINYANVLDRAILSLSAGEEGWSRLLTAASPRVGQGHVLAAFEVNHDNGPWVRPDNYRNVNGVLRYSRGDTQNAFSLTSLVYDAAWNSTDQVPARAIAQHVIPRFGATDTTDGGDTNRESLSAEYQHTNAQSLTRAIAFVYRYQLNLFSNFTYFLSDPVHGDQFEQADRRWVSGLSVSHRRSFHWGDRTGENMVGLQVRYDDIPTVGLYHTQARTRLTTVRQDAVREGSVGLFAQNELRWASWLRTTLGVRVDGYHFDVRSNDAANSGDRASGLASPKAAAVLGPWKKTEFYANAGGGYHSNDARGTTITRNPTTDEPVDPVTPLVRAKGGEFGVRSVAIPRVQTTLALWRLDLASELVFAGDAGSTDASRPSERYGVEWSNYVRLTSCLTADADLAWSRARFTNADPAGSLIPGAVQTVVSAGITFEPERQWFGSVRLRCFGPRPLIEDNSARSRPTNLLNGQIGYRLTPTLRIVIDAFNLTNAAASDVDYFYVSRLSGEPSVGVADIHTHPTIPRTLRVGVHIGF